MISDTIKDLRRRNYLNQTAFANKVGVTQGTVSQWENDLIKPSSEQLLAISRAFNISVDDLLKGEPQTTQSNNAPRTSEAQIVSTAVDKMPQADRTKALNLLKAVYSEYFDSAEEKSS